MTEPDEDRPAGAGDPEGATVRAAEDAAGAVATFPYDAATVERFREAFPRARWREDRRAWFVPGRTAERRVALWLDRERPSAGRHADERGRDAFAFDGLASPYLEVGEDLRIRTPYSRAVVAELRAVPWAWWDGEAKAWRAPFRSWEALRRRWPAIEEAARRSEPAERRARRRAAEDGPERAETLERARERRRRRHPVEAERPPPLGRVLMTASGSVLFTAVTDEPAARSADPSRLPVPDGGTPLVWARWRRPSHEELVRAWPSRTAPTEDEKARGWWSPTLPELREERRKARSIERAQATRRSVKAGGGGEGS